MKPRQPERMAFIVPFAKDDQFPIQATTIQACVDALDAACAFRQVESKAFALAKLIRYE